MSCSSAASRSARSAVGLAVDRLLGQDERVRVDVLVLHRARRSRAPGRELRQDVRAEAGVDEQLDPAARVPPEDELAQLDLHPLLRDPRQLGRHRRHGRDSPRCRGEVELGDEPRRAQHPQRIVGERLLGRGRGVQRAGGERGEATVRVDEAPVPLDLATGQLDGHRVDREVAPDQVVLDHLTEGDDRVAAHPVVRVGPERGDLDGRSVPARADRPERDPRVPDRLGPALGGQAPLVGGRRWMKSRSVCSRLSRASRTLPPTR